MISLSTVNIIVCNALFTCSYGIIASSSVTVSLLILSLVLLLVFVRFMPVCSLFCFLNKIINLYHYGVISSSLLLTRVSYTYN